jgi:hypothetical protein
VVKPEAVTEVVDDKPVKVLTPSTSLPQANADSEIRMTFDAASPTPVNCNEHDSVNVHCVASVYGPDT